MLAHDRLQARRFAEAAPALVNWIAALLLHRMDFEGRVKAGFPHSRLSSPMEMAMRLVNWLGVLTVAAFALTLWCPEAQASDVKFGKWMKDKKEDRYYCEYQYPDKAKPKTKTNVQTMIWYPNDKARKGNYYFANKDNKVWGKCVCPADPNYDPKVMQWSKMVNGKWKELPKGDCPAPANGDPEGASIDKIPRPPA